MDTPEKHKPPITSSPSSNLPISHASRSPRSPAFIALGPLEKVKYRYAAGVLPITYVVNEVTKALEWKILLCIEFRRLEQRLCIHPLAGKKEVDDKDFPIKTAVREFNEESYGVFKDDVLERELEASVRDHAAWLFIQNSRMYFFFAYIPYVEDIQARYLQAKGENKTGEALFWYPLDDFIHLKGKITTSFKNENIKPSDCCQMWFHQPEFRDGYIKFKDIISKRLSEANSQLDSSTNPQSNAPIDLLSTAIANLGIATEDKPAEPVQAGTQDLPKLPLHPEICPQNE